MANNKLVISKTTYTINKQTNQRSYNKHRQNKDRPTATTKSKQYTHWTREYMYHFFSFLFFSFFFHLILRTSYLLLFSVLRNRLRQYSLLDSCWWCQEQCPPWKICHVHRQRKSGTRKRNSDPRGTWLNRNITSVKRAENNCQIYFFSEIFVFCLFELLEIAVDFQ